MSDSSNPQDFFDTQTQASIQKQEEENVPPIFLREPEPAEPQLKEDDGTNTREPPADSFRNTFDDNPGQELPTREDMNPDVESRAERDMPMQPPD